jgi:hypothetical protein
MNAWNGRGSDPENFGARITRKWIYGWKDMGFWSAMGKILILGGSRGYI